MKPHLSSEQLESVLNGEPSQTVSQHLSGCAECAGELKSLREAFGNLREATTAAAEHHRSFVSTAGSRETPRMAWALAASVLFVSITTPFVLHHRNVVPVAVTGTATVAPPTISDEALLNGVQNDLSVSVPEPLLPLAGTSTDSTNARSQ